jgi:hypothetical protein
LANAPGRCGILAARYLPDLQFFKGTLGVLIPPSSGDAERLRGFFAEAGYTQETMLGKLGMAP